MMVRIASDGMIDAAYVWLCKRRKKDYDILFDQVAGHVSDPVVLDLVRQYLARSTEHGGQFAFIERGISTGCPSSLVSIQKTMPLRVLVF